MHAVSEGRLGRVTQREEQGGKFSQRKSVVEPRTKTCMRFSVPCIRECQSKREGGNTTTVVAT
ncbi:hypothetical protein VFPFJ_03271 [Purpureocillium lilacinum]|uniref:Uncharacterized protein n=1 Tax=Purpureocillium lilacinum TaxID=33203 RepID=A0A179HPQ9_PURLI|nr:hypothetical protein VFPFJ_03271 [Purpureocillium lilacinum]OAQ91531.1 hypothetical protein VFPFJ_03271 [Purpureocillium lilacinum]